MTPQGAKPPHPTPHTTYPIQEPAVSNGHAPGRAIPAHSCTTDVAPAAQARTPQRSTNPTPPTPHTTLHLRHAHDRHAHHTPRIHRTPRTQRIQPPHKKPPPTNDLHHPNTQHTTHRQEPRHATPTHGHHTPRTITSSPRATPTTPRTPQHPTNTPQHDPQHPTNLYVQNPHSQHTKHDYRTHNHRARHHTTPQHTRPRHHRKHSPHRDHTTTKHPHHTDIHVPPQGHHLTDTDTGIPTHPTAGPNGQAPPGPHTPVTERKPTHAKTLHHTGKHPTPHTLHRHSRPQHGGRPTGRVQNPSTPPVPTPSELAHTRITNTQATTSTPVTTHHLDPLWLPGEGFEHTARSRLCTGVTHVTITPVTLHRGSALIAWPSAGLKAGYVIPW